MLDLSRLRKLTGSQAAPRGLDDPSWTGGFSDYLEILVEEPGVCRCARQRVLDMIRGDLVGAGDDRLRFFAGMVNAGADVPGELRESLDQLVEWLRVSCLPGASPRPLHLAEGPLSSVREELLQHLMRGLEEYSRSPRGALYTFRWRLSDGRGGDGVEFVGCPVNEDPLRLVPEEARKAFLEDLTQASGSATRIDIEGPPCPACRKAMERLLRKYQGDWPRMADHVSVVRLGLSRSEGVGFGSLDRAAAGVGPEGESAALEALGRANRGILAISPSSSGEDGASGGSQEALALQEALAPLLGHASGTELSPDQANRASQVSHLEFLALS